MVGIVRPSHMPFRAAPKPRGVTPDSEDMSNFLKGCASGSSYAVKEFLRYWPNDIECYWTNSHRTGLLMAALNGHESIVRLLIDNKARLFTTDNEGCNALMLAALSGNEKLVEFLLGKGFKANGKDNNGFTALHHYVTGDKERGGPGIPALLVKHGANIDDDSPAGFRPLQWAITTGRKIVFRTLLDLGADVTSQPILKAAAEQEDKDFLLQLEEEPARRRQLVDDAVNSGIGNSLKVKKPFNISTTKVEKKPPPQQQGRNGQSGSLAGGGRGALAALGVLAARPKGRSWTA